MDRVLELEIIDELRRQLDNKVNIDSGVQYRNPTSVYTCPDLADQEWQEFFRKHPQLIGLSGDLPEPGSFMTVSDFGVPVLATRGQDGQFRAFLNACRHRGVRVAGEARGQANKFMCPFHNWTYSNQGDLVAIPREHDFGTIDKSCHGLIELPAEEKYGLLFVHPEPQGSLDVDLLLSGLGPELAQWHYGDLRYVGESVMTNDLNWKLANDTFGETYHFERLHRNTLGKLFHGDALHYTEFGRNHRFVWAEKSISHTRELPREQWNYEAATGQLYYLFPNIQLTAGTHSCSVIKIYPDQNNPRKSITRVGHYFSQEMIDLDQSSTNRITPDEVYDIEARGKGATFSLDAAMEIFDSTIEQEDYVMGESTQRSADSGVMDYVMFGRNEPALHHYHNTFRAALGMPPMRSGSE